MLAYTILHYLGYSGTSCSMQMHDIRDKESNNFIAFSQYWV